MLSKVMALVQQGEATWHDLPPELDREMEEARSVLLEACMLGHQEACFFVATIYQFGYGVKPLRSRAVTVRCA